ncbi:MAG TPA: response regulator transcription factor [Actinomycetota bacterium]|nr:response regulator transcription factor [Actinomycetota bacterium]
MPSQPARPPKIRILIAEDHTVLAQALATMLSFDTDFEVVGTVPSGDEAIAVVRRSGPDVVLMDYKLKGLNGIEATREIVRLAPATKVLVLSMFDSQETVIGAVAAGAAGFLPKNVDREELVRAIHAIAEGKGFLHPEVTMPFLQRIGALAKKDTRQTLTDREQVVLQELALGKTTKEIAGTLVVSEETVKTHLAHIYQKLGVNDRVQAVALALRQGLVR